MIYKAEETCVDQGLVSIAIPAYKTEFLVEAINSALGQDYLNLELIIVNDASPYDIDTIINSYTDSRIRYYKNECNLGKQSIVLNWNKCLSLAKGNFFILLCDDDMLKPNFVSELLRLATQYPSCNVFHARKINLYTDGHTEESPVWPVFELGESFIRNSLNKMRHHTVSEFMYRLPFFQQKGYINFPIGYYSDRATIMNVVVQGGLASSDNCLAVFRFSENHITSSKNSRYSLDKVRASLAYWNWIHSFFPASKEYDKQIKEDLQSTIFPSFICSSFYQKLWILYFVPNEIISFKLKLGYVWSWITNNRS